MAKYIYLPIEIKNREFMAKVICAFKLADAGYKIIVGKSTEVEKLCMMGPKGVYIGTSIVKQHRILFEKLQRNQQQIVAVDEEGLVYYNKEHFVKHRVDEKTINQIDAFFTWGEHHRQLVKSKCPQYMDKIFSVGNIRMELLKRKYRMLFKTEADILREKHGKYILLNTNFAAYNHYKNSETYKNDVKSFIEVGEKEQKLVNDKIEHQRITFDEFASLAKKIKTMLPDYKVVVRPHPSENRNRWLEKLQGTDVEVIHEGNVIPWIMSASCVIQQNCTTAIEAVCVETPVYSFLPTYDVRFDDGLPNKVVPIFYNQSDVLNAIKKVIEKPECYEEILRTQTKEKLQDYIDNLDEKDTFEAYEKILSGLVKETTMFNSWNLLKFKYFLYEKISLLLNKKKRGLQEYFKHKYPDTPIEEWNELKEKCKKNGMNFGEVHLISLAPNSYLVEKR